MTRSYPTRVFRTVGVALLPAVVLLCCAGRADAGCGDHVRIVGSDGTACPPAGHGSMPAERPCQGPECTGGPKVPAPVPPAPPSPSSDVKGLMADTGADYSPDGTRFAPESNDSPIHRPASIFDPPRTS